MALEMQKSQIELDRISAIKTIDSFFIMVLEFTKIDV